MSDQNICDKIFVSRNCNTIKRNIFTVHYTIDFRRIGVDNSKQCHLHSLRDLSETVAQRCSVKKVFLKIS